RREPAFKYLSFRIRFSGEESAFCPGAHPFAFFAKRRGLFPSHVGAGALTRPGGDFFRAAEGNLLSHTCHSEERRDESLLSNTCYFHRRWRMTTVDLSHSAHHVTTEFVLPVLEDADSIQITLGQIMRMIVCRQVDTKSAGLLLYALQIASANLRRTRFEPYHKDVTVDLFRVPERVIGDEAWSPADFKDANAGVGRAPTPANQPSPAKELSGGRASSPAEPSSAKESCAAPTLPVPQPEAP